MNRETASVPSAKQEWRAKWPLPIVSMLGYAGASCFAYSSGVFMTGLTREFGWTRAAFSTAFTLQTVLGLIILPQVGRLVDRYGSRRLALVGLIPYVVGFGLLGTASGPIWQWWALCLGQALLGAMVSSSTWITAVARKFDAGRGLALATVLAGTGLSTAVWPLLATAYITHFGWRLAFPALALSWAVVMLPLVLLFVRDEGRIGPAGVTPDPGRHGEAPPPRLAVFIMMLAAGGMIASVSFGLTLHFVPILQGDGFSLEGAAKMAGIGGIFAIVGRFVTGFLLDRLPIRRIAVAVFLLPIPIALLLGHTYGPGIIALSAAILLGFASGAETDVLVYMLAQRFSRETLGGRYGIMLSVLAGCAGLGPLLAGALFDATGGYTAYLVATVPLTIFATILVAIVS